MSPIKRRLVRRKPVEEDDEDEEVDDEDLEVEDEVDDEDEDEDEEEEVKSHKAPRGITTKIKEAPKAAKPEKVQQKKLVAVPEEEEEVVSAKKIKVQKVEETQASSLLLQVMGNLEEGNVMIITNLGNGKYSIGYSSAAPVANKIRGKAYWDTVVSPDYKTWSHEWHQKSYDEKVKFAQKKKIKWDSHPNPKVDVIRLTEAVRAALGVEKYKEEYRSRSARATLRG